MTLHIASLLALQFGVQFELTDPDLTALWCFDIADRLVACLQPIDSLKCSAAMEQVASEMGSRFLYCE
jgi:hypothetical protein